MLLLAAYLSMAVYTRFILSMSELSCDISILNKTKNVYFIRTVYDYNCNVHHLIEKFEWVNPKTSPI